MAITTDGFVGTIVGVVLAAVPAAFWYGGIDQRLNRIEAQLVAVGTQPLVSVDGKTVVNPLLQACAEVSSKLASTIADGPGFGTDVDAYREQLVLLNCKASP